MTERELIGQLNKSRITPDQAWKEKNREILLSQIFPGQEAGVKAGMGLIEKFDVWAEAIVPFDLLHKLVAKPVLVTGLVLASLLSGGVFSIQAAKNTKPGDSLYIAKIVSEKAQLALTFDEMEKAKLGVEFAGNRAKEAVLVMEEDKNDASKSAKVEKLAADFKNEIDSAKGRLEKIGVRDAAAVNGGSAVGNSQNQAKGGSEDKLFGAGTGKVNGGIQVSGPQTTAPKNETPKAGQAADSKATSSAENLKASENKQTPENILNDAQELFEKKDYSGAVDKLEKMFQIIDKINDDQSLNDSNATSTGKMEMSTK